MFILNSLISMRKFYILMVCSLPLILVAEEKFKVSEIPENLKVKADAVIRIDETIFTIDGLSSGDEEKHWAVTILNEKGEDNYNRFIAYYDKLSKVKRIEGNLYNAQGELLKSLKGKDILDFGLSAFGNDVIDSRLKIASFEKKAYPYPYTVEFHYVSESKNMMFYSFWNPFDQERTSIQSSTFTVVSLKDFPFRMKEIGLTSPAAITTKDNKRYYSWKLQNQPAYEEEPNSPKEIHPCVMTAPWEFEIQGYHGCIQDWNDIGKFYYTLNKDRDILTEETKSKAKELVKDEENVSAKIKILYEYMQANTRYMSIQLGLGGWQTIEAKDVAEKGYGDCKALSNYMKALLKAVGIPACQALVAAGSSSAMIYPDFACMRFN